MSRIEELIKEKCPNGVPYFPLNEISKFKRGKGLKKDDIGTGNNNIILYGELYTTYGNYINEIVSQADVSLIKNPTIASKGDLLLPISSTTAAAQIGRASVLLVDNVIIGGDAIVISHKFNPGFLMHYINGSIFETQKMRCVSGTTIRHLSPSDMMKIKVHM